MIKLMHITHDLAIGGLQKVVVNICKTIDMSIFDVSVLCLRGMGEFVDDIEILGIKVFQIPHVNGKTDYFSFIKVAKILNKEKIEVIHTHNTQPFIDGTLGSLFSGVKTIIHTDHARIFPDKMRYMIAERLMSYFAYKVVGVSDHTSLNLIKYEKISSKKIITIENGIDESCFNIEIDKQEIKKKLGISIDGPVLGLCVRLEEQKGITYLLQAMPQIIKVKPNVSLIIVGDGKLKTELENEAVQLGIKEHVLFLGSRLDVPIILRLFDIYVLPSLWEGLPMVLLEAMAAGCPVVASDVGGVSKAITNAENGLLVFPGDPQQLADGIIKLLSDSKVRKMYGEKGIEKFKANFSAAKMTERYEKLYQRID
jgi:glycosyltransferase involved in cell wall biosynthesis